MPLYLCRRWEGTPQPLEHTALKWVRPKDMADYPMPPADLPLIPDAARSALTRASRDRNGATAIEYALIAGLISILVVTGATTIGQTVKTFFEQMIVPFL